MCVRECARVRVRAQSGDSDLPLVPPKRAENLYMVPQGIRPVVQLTAVEVTSCLKMHLPLAPPTGMTSNCVCACVYSDSSVGPEKHEAVPTGCSVLTKPGGGVRRAAGGVGRHQEHEEEPQLPQLRPLHQSGKDKVA